MLNVQNKLESTMWCSDRRAYSDETAIPGITIEMSYDSSLDTAYAPVFRLHVSKNPSLECPNSNDQFLGYYGLITSDEGVYAGGVIDIANSSYYLNTGREYWTMSPSFGGNDYSSVLLVQTSGDLQSFYVDSWSGVRPMVSLNSSATISGGNGSSGTPYIIN